MIQTFEDLCTYAYVTVDELFQASVLPHDHRPGPRATFSDSEVITLTLVAEIVGLDDETVFLDDVNRNHRARFPLLPDRSRSNRRRRALGEATNTIRRQLLSFLLALLPPDERPLCVLESLPVPVVGFHHARAAALVWLGHLRLQRNQAAADRWLQTPSADDCGRDDCRLRPRTSPCDRWHLH